MKYGASILVLLVCATASTAQPLRETHEPGIRLTHLPLTDADLERASHSEPRLHNFVNDLVDGLKIRDGKADIFDSRDLDSRTEISGSLDMKGATLRIRW